ncbi:MAG: biotin--[acetyl-CoA-carboxylase] ligase [Candidatus Nanopelagicales bacterium]
MAAAMSSAQPLLMGLLSDQPLATADLTWVESTGSTNADLVNDLASNHASAWSIRIATKQSHGRGRQGRSWESPTGSIPVSIAVPLDEFTPAPTWLSAITAIALRNAIREFIAEPISIKWPNDCLIANQKFAGILIERHNNFAVVGVGINFFGAPDLPTATHLNLAKYLPALAKFIHELIFQVQQAAKLTNDQLRQQIAAELTTLGQLVEVELTDGAKIIGVAKALTDSGGLVLATEAAEIEVIAGDVNHLRSAHAS